MRDTPVLMCVDYSGEKTVIFGNPPKVQKAVGYLSGYFVPVDAPAMLLIKPADDDGDPADEEEEDVPVDEDGDEDEE